jgi:hypothetical protein
MMAEVSFPAPNPYYGPQYQPGPPGKAYTKVDYNMIHAALYQQSNKKAPGKDSISIPVIKILLRWDPSRVTPLVSQCLCLGYHLEEWKVAKGICIPKPGKKTYNQAKCYQVISLLSCLGKLIEKVATIVITNDIEFCHILHEGQYGACRGWSAVDAAGVLLATVKEIWEKKKIAAALMMDVKGAFPTVNCTCLLHKMHQAKIDENLVQWMDSFMSNHRVEITMNGEPGLAIETNIGLPQGSPVSPVLFLIYIADLVALIEKEVDRTVGLSFVDDVT